MLGNRVLGIDRRDLVVVHAPTSTPRAEATVRAARARGVRPPYTAGELARSAVCPRVGCCRISHQRVAQIIAADPIAPKKRPKLHEATIIVLKDFGSYS